VLVLVLVLVLLLILVLILIVLFKKCKMSPRAAEGSQKGGASIEATMATHEVTMATLTPSSGKGGAEAPLALQSTTPLDESNSTLKKEKKTQKFRCILISPLFYP